MKDHFRCMLHRRKFSIIKKEIFWKYQQVFMSIGHICHEKNILCQSNRGKAMDYFKRPPKQLLKNQNKLPKKILLTLHLQQVPSYWITLEGVPQESKLLSSHLVLIFIWYHLLTKYEKVWENTLQVKI